MFVCAKIVCYNLSVLEKAHPQIMTLWIRLCCSFNNFYAPEPNTSKVTVNLPIVSDLLTGLTYILVQITFHPNYGAYDDINNIEKPLVPCLLSITFTIMISMQF